MKSCIIQCLAYSGFAIKEKLAFFPFPPLLGGGRNKHDLNANFSQMISPPPKKKNNSRKQTHL